MPLLKKSLITSYLLFTANVLYTDGLTQDIMRTPHPHQIIFRHLEGSGIGFNKGYSTLEAMLITSKSTQFLPYLNLRGHIFNDGNGAGNFGGGFRYVRDSMCQAMGINAFMISAKPIT